MDYNKYGPERDYNSGFDYGYDVDHTEVYVKQYREMIEGKGFVRYSSFSEIEPDYKVAIIQKPENGLPRVITGRFLGMKEEYAQIESKRKGLGRLLSNTRVINLPDGSASNYEIYASSGSFDSWESIASFLAEG